MNYCLLISLLAVLADGDALGATNDDRWVSDWPNLSDSGHLATRAQLDGVTADGTHYRLNLATKVVSSKELEGAVGVKYYGLNRRDTGALNAQLTTLELVYGSDTLKVPNKALLDILNASIGEGMNLIFSRDKQHIKAIIINGPDGGEGYMVAFIFENGRFSRRQVRSNTASQSGWPVLQDKRY